MDSFRSEDEGDSSHLDPSRLRIRTNLPAICEYKGTEASLLHGQSPMIVAGICPLVNWWVVIRRQTCLNSLARGYGSNSYPTD